MENSKSSRPGFSRGLYAQVNKLSCYSTAVSHKAEIQVCLYSMPFTNCDIFKQVSVNRGPVQSWRQNMTTESFFSIKYFILFVPKSICGLITVFPLSQWIESRLRIHMVPSNGPAMSKGVHNTCNFTKISLTCPNLSNSSKVKVNTQILRLLALSSRRVLSNYLSSNLEPSIKYFSNSDCHSRYSLIFVRKHGVLFRHVFITTEEQG